MPVYLAAMESVEMRNYSMLTQKIPRETRRLNPNVWFGEGIVENNLLSCAGQEIQRDQRNSSLTSLY